METAQALQAGRGGTVTLTYVSTSLIAPDCQAEVVDAMLVAARRFNAANGISGALLSAGTFFVQTLEGNPVAVDALMGRITSDARHRILRVVERRPVAHRTYAAWSMVYSGASQFVADAVARALASRPGARSDGDRRLVRLVRDFSLVPPDAGKS